MVRTDIDGVVCSYASQGIWSFGSLIFSSEFCSGNIASVEAVDEANTTFELRSSPDCAGTEFETNYRTWFHFSISGANKDQVVTLCIMNLNPQAKMFNQGMRPVFRVGERGKWDRIPQEVSHSCGEGRQFQIRFRHRFTSSEGPVFFAFCYPYSFEETMRKVDILERSFGASSAVSEQPTLSEIKPDTIYFHRETMTKSLDGRRIELLTISDMHGISDAREPLLDGLFPGQTPEQRPFLFPGKSYFFLSARVHPGETPAQWMWEGLMDFLLLLADPRARALRRGYVFKVVPIINPDGVARGHYRADTQGLNLNRFYDSPDRLRHPAIWAIREVVVALRASTRLKFFVDLHAHATKRGCFCYANALPRYEEQIENMLFARLVAVNCPHFDFNACVFSEKAMETRDKNGQSKEGSSRVGVYRASGLVHSITVECNYNCGRVVNVKPPANTQDGRASPAESWRGPLPKYNIPIFRDVGKSVGVAVLDLDEKNPWSRVGHGQYKGLPELREFLRSRLVGFEPYKTQLLQEKRERDAAQREKKEQARREGRDKENDKRGTKPTGLKRGASSRLVTGAGTASSGRGARVMQRTQSDRTMLATKDKESNPGGAWAVAAARRGGRAGGVGAVRLAGRSASAGCCVQVAEEEGEGGAEAGSDDGNDSSGGEGEVEDGATEGGGLTGRVAEPGGSGGEEGRARTPCRGAGEMEVRVRVGHETGVTRRVASIPIAAVEGAHKELTVGGTRVGAGAGSGDRWGVGVGAGGRTGVGVESVGSEPVDVDALAAASLLNPAKDLHRIFNARRTPDPTIASRAGAIASAARTQQLTSSLENASKIPRPRPPPPRPSSGLVHPRPGSGAAGGAGMTEGSLRGSGGNAPAHVSRLSGANGHAALPSVRAGSGDAQQRGRHVSAGSQLHLLGAGSTAGAGAMRGRAPMQVGSLQRRESGKEDKVATVRGGGAQAGVRGILHGRAMRESQEHGKTDSRDHSGGTGQGFGLEVRMAARKAAGGLSRQKS